MRRLLLVLVTCFYTVCCFSQKGISVNGGAKSASIGGITTTLDGADALFGNFAAITSSNEMMMHLSTSRRFSLSELQSVSLGFHIPVKKFGHFAVELSNYGFEQYQEQFVSLKYAKKVAINMSISGQLGVQTLDLQEYGSTNAFVYALGIHGKIGTDLSYGVVISNPEPQFITDESPFISDIRLGFKYQVSTKVSTFTEIVKELEESLNFKVGISYDIHQKFALRAGYNSSPGQNSFGFSYLISNAFILDAAVLYDGLLGLTPAISFKWNRSQIDN